MNIKSFLAIPYAYIVRRKINQWASKPEKTQLKILKKLLNQARNTTFGRAHNFNSISTYKAFKNNIPIRDYEAIRPYIELIVKGESNVLWKGKPIYLAKTSGTTSGAKFIPITKESMPYQIEAAKNALLMYIAETGKAEFLNGKLMFLQGSPIIGSKNSIKTGRLSGIVAHYVPKYLQKSRMPSWETNCIDDWETKVDKIVDETLNEDMRLISGIPSWVQMYFERLIQKTGKNIKELFPNFNLFVYGGVNFEPYRNNFDRLIGAKIDTIELFPASEGFFAFQDRQNEKGMLLLLNSGIFYEFVPADEIFNKNPTRISIADVQLGINYAMIISTNAGLWGYNIGDTIEFTSLIPHRIIVTGRIKHFISAFGEHVIAKEVEFALKQVTQNTNISVNEFTVAPEINPIKGLPYHEWFIEFENEPENMDQFTFNLDKLMQEQNSYYLDLIKGKILKTLVVNIVKRGGFQNYMKSVGKLGGQNKIPRLSNDRNIAGKLKKWTK
jgi:hypothetical protein